MRRSFLIILLLVLVIHSFTLEAQPSSGLDPGFGVGGWFFHDETSNDGFNDVVVQADGKIVLVGYFGLHGGFLVVRVDESGILDPAFGAGGVVMTTFGNSSEESQASSVVLQPDGRILVAGKSGEYNGANSITLCRYLTNGGLDATFGDSGCAFAAPEATNNWGRDLVLLSDGSITVASAVEAASFDVALVRFTGNGILDTTFGVNGVARFDIAGGNDWVNDIALDATGALVMTGRTYVTDNYDFFTARFTSDGDPDASFGTGGLVVENLGSFDDATAVKCIEDQKILVAGYTDSVDLTLVRYGHDGAPDGSFGSGGYVVLDWDAGGFPVTALTRGPDGTLFAVGIPWDGVNNIGVAAFAPDGAPIIGFGIDGVAIIDSGDQDLPAAATMDPRGRLVVAGFSTVTDADAMGLRLLAQDAETIFWNGFESGSADFWSSTTP